MKKFLYRMLCGAFLGISVIAPGVSGSIMAVMMGIYDELITVISNPFRNFKKNVIFVFPMIIGAGISMLLMLEVLNFLFENYTVPAYLLFISLIAGSIPTVYGEAKKGKIKPYYYIFTLLALAFALCIGLTAKSGSLISLDEENLKTTASLVYFCISGGVAGMMSMLPGMSVSMVLMMFGVYDHLLKSAAELDLLTVVPVGLCFLFGMVLFSNITKKVFEKNRSLGFISVLGFMVGSLISVFPGLPSGITEWIMSVIAICIGVGISILFGFLGKKFNVEK